MQQTPITWPRFENTWRNQRQYLEKDAFEVLKKHTLIEPRALKHLWNGPGRFYHDWTHARYLMSLALQMRDRIEQDDVNFEHLILAVLFHDVIYVPGSTLNELMSAELLKGCLKPDGWNIMGPIYEAIMATAYGGNSGKYPAEWDIQPLSWWLQQLDLYQLIQGEAQDLRDDQMINFIKVYHEFENVLLWNGLAQNDQKKQAFEEKQNQFLVDLSKRFSFPYTPLTWEEIYQRDTDDPLRQDPIDIDDI